MTQLKKDKAKLDSIKKAVEYLLDQKNNLQVGKNKIMRTLAILQEEERKTEQSLNMHRRATS
ncbi:hypothetical protein [Mucilaginibacter jinjuensis]|uniref:Uncharacterized protein n=1 Tax=Mucilaginibacter jinjuensis TaxID=1176721 RepID=A0ABY7TB23_9SPHI|nr:hypothetical protein [Mucilaginibacter jinjuensis]WCT13715.1 hypothetical protein PQO05_07175 [Mucilaginibacter jinjuensis]